MSRKNKKKAAPPDHDELTKSLGRLAILEFARRHDYEVRGDRELFRLAGILLAVSSDTFDAISVLVDYLDHMSPDHAVLQISLLRELIDGLRGIPGRSSGI